jgi:hypothetical protein
MNIFDRIIARHAHAQTSFMERDALQQLWAQGENCRLREDSRFRCTPWGRWMLAERFLANDLVWERLQEGVLSKQAILAEARSLELATGRRLTICFGDPRIKWLDVTVVAVTKQQRSKDFPTWGVLLRLTGYYS